MLIPLFLNIPQKMKFHRMEGYIAMLGESYSGRPAFRVRPVSEI